MKFWVANYSVSFPRIAKPFTNWDFWQFTESMPAAAYGFPPDGERAMDMNYFNGSMETFLAFCFPSSAGTDEQQLERRIEWEVPKPTLVKGNTGIEVLKLQDLLVKFGFMTSAQLATGPGIFGPRTSASLINMQAALGCPPPGSYDDSTRTAVIARYYTEQPPPIIVPPPAARIGRAAGGREADVQRPCRVPAVRGQIGPRRCAVSRHQGGPDQRPGPGYAAAHGRLVGAGLPEEVRHGYCHQWRWLVLDARAWAQAHPNRR